MQSEFLDLIGLVERLHRQCLEMIKADLESQGTRDLSNVQALILFNVGEEELSMGELTNRGYYLGSNVSYNIKKMIENGYMTQHRSPHDRRSFYVRATDKGLAVYARISTLFDEHTAHLAQGQLDEEGLDAANETLRLVQSFWSAASVPSRALASA